MNAQIIMNTIGGLALFLLAMMMMTDGLKVFAGSGLRKLLSQFTSTPLKGVFAGILVTGLVQSSGAVTVAIIGFVNAGMMTLRQALGVVFGSNVGTTMTGWLVSLVGFGLNVEAFAMPLLALGVGLRVGSSGKRYRGLGEALAGFGLFFLGLAILKHALESVALSHGATAAVLQSGGSVSFLLIGFVITVLTQSSSASLAIVLTAASGGIIGVETAAAAVIGANLGSTSTAAVAALNATPNARRLALGHIIFNLITGLAALSMLPFMTHEVELLAGILRLEGSPAAVLALFHTVFNTMGVVIMLPLAGRLSRLLERAFTSVEEQSGQPQHLDMTLTATPVLAISALRAELARLRGIANQLVRGALLDSSRDDRDVERQSDAVRSLVVAIADFIGAVRTERMPLEVGENLARSMRIARYLGEAARLSEYAVLLRHETGRVRDREITASLRRLIDRVGYCCELAGQDKIFAEHDDQRLAALERFEAAYQIAKSELLDAVVERRLTVDETDQLLGSLSHTRRMVEQLVKADRMLRSPAVMDVIEAEKRDTRTGV